MMRILFFVLLFGLTLLGDGKQAMVDVVAAAGILCLFVVHRMRRGVIVALPRRITLAWGVLLVYFLIRTLFSDSVGYSISASLRWVMAYLVFAFFNPGAHEKKSEDGFANLVLWFGVFVVVASSVVTAFGALGRALPGMNLLYPAYGHNHLAAILVFIFPLVLYRRTLLAIFLGVALFLSFARGAWFLIFGYLWYFLRKNRTALAGILVAAVAALSFVMFSKNLPGGLVSSPLFHRQIIKDAAIANRLPYWKQAALAIRERPLFGAGPGTFYLLSKRFQDGPDRYSWYAHSFPLELVSEIGVIGLIGVIWLVGTILRNVRRGPLLSGVVLTFIYSLYEINLNFLVIWLLFWAALGTLFRAETLRHKNNYLPILSLIVLVLFYVSSVVASVLTLFPATRPLAFYIEPYIVARAIARLDESKTQLADIKTIEFFHKNDPEILILFARKYEQEKNFSIANLYYELAKNQDPLNKKNTDLRTIFYLRSHQYATFLHEYRKILTREHADFTPDVLRGASISNGDIAEDYREVLASQFRISSYSTHETSRNLFLLGLAQVDANPPAARQLFLTARDLSPGWSYFHLALASYYAFFENQKELARSALTYCLRFSDAKKHCNEIIDSSIPTLKEIMGLVLAMP